eukprot:SAG31_NODE_14359_length_811_cov_1.411517_3_plen_125_part_01
MKQNKKNSSTYGQLQLLYVGLPKFLCEQDCYAPPPPPPAAYDCQAPPVRGNCTLRTDGFGRFNTSADCMASPQCSAPPPPAPPGGWRPDWMTFYGMDAVTNGSGVASFSNLICGQHIHRSPPPPP